MPNSNGWGDGALNNTIGWGQGSINNINNWGEYYEESYAGLTDIIGLSASFRISEDDFDRITEDDLERITE